MSFPTPQDARVKDPRVDVLVSLFVQEPCPNALQAEKGVRALLQVTSRFQFRREGDGSRLIGRLGALARSDGRGGKERTLRLCVCCSAIRRSSFSASVRLCYLSFYLRIALYVYLFGYPTICMSVESFRLINMAF